MNSTINQSINIDEYEEIGNNKHGQEEATSKKPKEYSNVWNYFTKKEIGQDGIQRGECKACKKEYKCGGKQYGTSTLRRHLQNCKMEIMAYESQTIRSAGKSELDLYLEELKLEFVYYQNLDVLEHWKNHKHRYPSLSLMACDILSIPITTVASESTFSIGAHVLTKYRSRILPEKVQALICTRNWLRGYVYDDDECANFKTTTSQDGSNVVEIFYEETVEGAIVEDED
ncbi:uncharacterized protein LOC142528079 isoform X2 [Primulina tabacum]|uniref:uncharacterized protein LOC142528079 isoform X2 n=1 Tax=Primulina tabacum TaxID=48773 RepID=UPI003F59FC5C